MDAYEEFGWSSILSVDDERLAYGIERVLYVNGLRSQLKEVSAGTWEIWVPNKFKDLSIDVAENHLIDNLADGFIQFDEKKEYGDNIRVGDAYERHIPRKFYIFLLLIAIFLLCIRFIYSIDFL